jgi:hypothetical protein
MSRKESLKICTWNVCLGIKYKLRQVEEIMQKNDIDIICRQEVELSQDDHLSLPHHAMFTQLEELENAMNLYQLVKFNTWRRVVNGELRTFLLDHVYENVHGLVESIAEISTSTSDHTPLLIDVAIKICHKVETKVVRNWSAYSKEMLLDPLNKKSWDTNCHDVQDFNIELGQKVLSVLEILIPFEEIKVQNNNFSKPLWLSDMKRKRKNLLKMHEDKEVPGYL